MAKGKRSPELQQMVDAHYMGPEPMFRDEPPTQLQLQKAYTWYNYFYTQEQGRDWLLRYMRSVNYTERQMQIIESIAPYKIPMVLCSISRMILNHSHVPEDSIEYFQIRLQMVLDANDSKVPHFASEEDPVKSVRDRMKEKTFEFIGDLDEAIDLFNEDFVPFDLIEWIDKNDIKGNHAKVLYDHYSRQLDEYEGAVSKSDPDLVQAYKHLSKKELTRRFAFFESLCQTLLQYAKEQKKQAIASKKPRKKRVKSNIQLVSKLSYMRHDPETKLQSIEPSVIPGCSQLWVYHAKKRTLTVFNALDGGLQVSRSSIRNFDTDTSETKKLRKPAQTLKELSEAGKVQLRHLMSKLSTSGKVPSGQINDETILVRAVK